MCAGETMQMRNLLIACVAIAALGQACAQVAPPGIAHLKILQD